MKRLSTSTRRYSSGEEEISDGESEEEKEEESEEIAMPKEGHKISKLKCVEIKGRGRV